MTHIPRPDEIPQAHYFLEQLDTPATIGAIRVSAILIALGLLLLYGFIVCVPRRRKQTQQTSPMPPIPVFRGKPGYRKQGLATATVPLTGSDGFTQIGGIQMSNQLKSGLFGYSKQNVTDYMRHISDDFSRQLREAEAAKEQEILELKEQVSRLQKENTDLHMQQMEVSSALIHAQIYSNQLKAESQEKQQEELAQTQAQYAAVRGRISLLAGDIVQLQSIFAQLLDKMNLDTQRCLEQCEDVAQELEEVQRSFQPVPPPLDEAQPSDSQPE